MATDSKLASNPVTKEIESRIKYEDIDPLFMIDY